MKNFEDWIKERKERDAKLVAFRRWMWSREHNHKDAPEPINSGDPDYYWVKMKAEKLGPLDPHNYA